MIEHEHNGLLCCTYCEFMTYILRCIHPQEEEEDEFIISMSIAMFLKQTECGLLIKWLVFGNERLPFIWLLILIENDAFYFLRKT